MEWIDSVIYRVFDAVLPSTLTPATDVGVGIMAGLIIGVVLILAVGEPERRRHAARIHGGECRSEEKARERRLARMEGAA